MSPRLEKRKARSVAGPPARMILPGLEALVSLRISSDNKPLGLLYAINMPAAGTGIKCIFHL